MVDKKISLIINDIKNKFNYDFDFALIDLNNDEINLFCNGKYFACYDDKTKQLLFHNKNKKITINDNVLLINVKEII